MKTRDLARDSLTYGLSSILSRALSLVLLPLYTRVLSPAKYGSFDLITTAGVLVALTVALEVSQGVGRLSAEVDSRGRQVLVSTGWWFSLIMYGTFCAVAQLFAPAIAEHVLRNSQLVLVCRLGIIYVALNGLFLFLQQQFRWDLQSKVYTVVNFGNGVLVLVLSVGLTVGLRLGLTGILIAQCLATAASILACLPLLRTRLRLQVSWQALGRMLRFSAPLVPAGVAVFVSLYFNRVALVHYASLRDVGLYGVANRVAGLATLLIVGVQGALTPLVYRHHADEETPRQLAKIFSIFSAGALVACLGLAMFGKELTQILATSIFDTNPMTVGLLAPALLLSQMYIFTPGIAIAKRTGLQLLVVLVGALVSFGLNVALVPGLGVIGAAGATLGASIVSFALWLFFSQRLYPVQFHSRSLLGGVAAFVVSLVIVAALNGSGWPEYSTLPLRLVLLMAFGLWTWRIGLIETSAVRQLRASLPSVRGR